MEIFQKSKSYFKSRKILFFPPFNISFAWIHFHCFFNASILHWVPIFGNWFILEYYLVELGWIVFYCPTPKINLNSQHECSLLDIHIWPMQDSVWMADKFSFFSFIFSYFLHVWKKYNKNIECKKMSEKCEKAAENHF